MYKFIILISSVDDASGHYTTGLFYGNNYWIGSLSLCKSIYKETTLNAPNVGMYNKHCNFHSFLNWLLFAFTVRTRQEKDEISFNDAYNPTETLAHENPPFIPAFFVLKAKINETEIVKYVSLKYCSDEIHTSHYSKVISHEIYHIQKAITLHLYCMIFTHTERFFF